MKHFFLPLFCSMTILSFGQTNQSGLHFDKVNDYATAVNVSALLVGKTAFSLTAWVYPTNSAPAFPNFDGILGIRNETNCDFYILQLSATTYEARFRNSTGTKFTISSATCTLNQWQHLALVYDGTSLKFYKNGILANTVPASGSFSNSTQALHIGRLPLNTTTSFYFGGKLDDVALWGKSLTASEVNCLFTGDISPNAAGLSLYYSMNDGIANGNNIAITALNPIAGSIPATLNGFGLNSTTSNFVTGVGQWTTVPATLCKGSSYMIGTQSFTTAGYHTIYTSTSAGCDSVYEINLTMDSTDFTITSTDVICYGQATGSATALPSFGGAPYSYVWNTTPVQTTSTASGLIAGTYLCTVTGSNGCSQQRSATVVQPASAIYATATLSSGSILASPTGANCTYQWVTCPNYTPIPNETNSFFTPISNGSYAAIVSVGGCTDTSDCVVVSGIGLSEWTLGTLTCVPNPSQNRVLVSWDVLPMLVPQKLFWANVSGQVVREDFIHPGINELDVSEVPNGVYLLKTDHGDLMRLQIIHP